jgi:Uma2 family endonuclease
MSPPGPTHEEAVDKLTRWSTANTDESVVRVRVQNSIGLPELESAPQPDIAWVREQSYHKGRPQSDDVFLVIEVSDSSLNYDRGKKARLYAEAGIADYWVVNLRDSCIEVFREPQDGKFQSHEVFERGHVVRPLRFPKVKLQVSKLLDWYAV